MAERLYTVTPFSVVGETFTIEGLQPALDAINSTWGGKHIQAKAVSPAMSLGGGAAFVAVEEGRVMIERDDEAQRRRKAALDDTTDDGRTRVFRADIAIGRVIGPKKAEHVAARTVDAEGLRGVFFEVAMFTQETLGDVPDCMFLEKVETRIPGIRSQLSRAKTQERESTVVNFPGSSVAPFFELGARPNEYYQVSVNIHVAEPAEETIMRRNGQ